MTDIIQVLTDKGGYTIEVRGGEIYIEPASK
jgi:hypothetical protein